MWDALWGIFRSKCLFDLSVKWLQWRGRKMRWCGEGEEGQSGGMAIWTDMKTKGMTGRKLKNCSMTFGNK